MTASLYETHSRDRAAIAGQAPPPYSKAGSPGGPLEAFQHSRSSVGAVIRPPGRCKTFGVPISVYEVRPVVGPVGPGRKRPPAGRCCFGFRRVGRFSESVTKVISPQEARGALLHWPARTGGDSQARHRQPGLRARATRPARLRALWSSVSSMEGAAQGPVARRARRWARRAHAARVGSKKTALAARFAASLQHSSASRCRFQKRTAAATYFAA